METVSIDETALPQQRIHPAAVSELGAAHDSTTTTTTTDVGAVVKHCMVCYSDLTHVAVTDCPHENSICGVCLLRLRLLHKDMKCPICKTPQEQIVVDRAPAAKRQLNEYPIWGNELGANFVFRPDVSMFFPVDYYHAEIEPLFGYRCTVQNCPYDGTVPDVNVYEQQQQQQFKPTTNNNKQQQQQTVSLSIRALQDHLRNKHRLGLCQLCVDHHRDFVSRLPRFTPSQLQKHLQKGDGKLTGFTGHPVCEFCRPTRFYDLTALHQHLAKDHYKCHVCEQHLALPNQYFNHYPSLEKHFDRQHFLCRDVQCLTARFVVFASELDLRAHELSVHGATSTGDSKLQLEFRVRRYAQDSQLQGIEAPAESEFNYALDGTAFQPADLPISNTNNNSAVLHPLHIQRTQEFREQAAARREEDNDLTGEDAFPVLQSSQAAAGDSALRVGWASGGTVQRLARATRNAGAVTEEDFPSLAATAPNKKKAVSAATSKLHAGVAPAEQQFAAMHMAANSVPSAAGTSWSCGIAATTSASSSLAPRTALQAVQSRNNAASLSADNFPSLAGSSRQPQRYKAADALARNSNASKIQKPPTWNSVTDFPAPPTASSSSSSSLMRTAKPSQTAPVKTQKPPSWNSDTDFPAPPTASHHSNLSLRAPKTVSSSHAASANVLQPTTSLMATKTIVSLDEIKVTMGSTKYKTLKGYTKEFATGQMEPDAYVDQAASLFDRGYADTDFWRFLPSLIDSCPNETSADQAMRYMENLRRMRNGAMNAEAAATRTPNAASTNTTNPTKSSIGSWTTAGPSITASPEPMAAPAAQGWSGVAAEGGLKVAPAGMRYVPPPQPVPAASLGKKKSTNAWGSSGGGASTVVRAKAPPGSVAVAAASAAPQTGTATKFMAKEVKQAKQQQQQQSKNKKKNNELKQLAFGS